MSDALDRKLSDVMALQRDPLRIRPSLLRSDFARMTTLSDLLCDPVGILEQLRLVPNVGDLNVVRTKKAIFTYLSDHFPTEWAVAARPAGQPASNDVIGTEPEPALVNGFRRLQGVWGYSEKSLHVTGSFHADYTSRSNSVFIAGLTAQSAFVYAPESLPEILKTPAVFKAEQGWSQQRADYLARLQATMSEEVVIPKGSLVLLDQYRLSELVEARGRYAGLTEADVAAQVTILRHMLCAVAAPTTIVTDFRSNGLSSGFATTEGPLLHYCFGGYLEMTTPEMVEHFHRCARAAAKVGTRLADWLEHRDVKHQAAKAQARS